MLSIPKKGKFLFGSRDPHWPCHYLMMTSTQKGESSHFEIITVSTFNQAQATVSFNHTSTRKGESSHFEITTVSTFNQAQATVSFNHTSTRKGESSHFEITTVSTFNQAQATVSFNHTSTRKGESSHFEIITVSTFNQAQATVYSITHRLEKVNLLTLKSSLSPLSTKLKPLFHSITHRLVNRSIIDNITIITKMILITK